MNLYWLNWTKVEKNTETKQIQSNFGGCSSEMNSEICTWTEKNVKQTHTHIIFYQWCESFSLIMAYPFLLCACICHVVFYNMHCEFTTRLRPLIVVCIVCAISVMSQMKKKTFTVHCRPVARLVCKEYSFDYPAWFCSRIFWICSHIAA